MAMPSLPVPRNEGEVSPVPADPKLTFKQLTNEQKAAIVLQVLGPDDAGVILDELDEREYRAFARGLVGLEYIPNSLVEEVVINFLERCGSGERIKGGRLEVRRYLENFLAADVVEQILEDVHGPVGRTIWEKLSNSPEEALACYLRTEQPQSVAVILSKLKPEKAARTLALFDEKMASEIVRRMAKPARLDKKVLDDIKNVLNRDFLSAVNRRQSTRQPADVIGAVFNFLPMELTENLLDGLRKDSGSLADDVQKVMFTFPDIANRLDGPGIQALLKEVDNETLKMALKLAREKMPKVTDFFFANMSKRAKELFVEELEEMPPVRAKEAEEAQQAIVRTAQELAKTGVITIEIQDEGGDQFI